MKPKLAYAFSHYTAFLDDASVGRPLPLLYGPSGAGKTYAIELCCKISGLPLSTIGGAGVSPAGYKGTTLRDLLSEHFDTHRRSEGVIFIDEIDKWCRGYINQYEKGDPEVVNMNMTKQAEMLRYMEGETVRFLEEGKDVDSLKGETFDTNRTFWIFAGAFVGLDRHINSRTGQEQISHDDIWEHAEPIDFIHYGMIEEFANRINAWSWVRPLDATQVITILDIQDVPKWKTLFAAMNCDLDLDFSALATAASLAIHNKRGPRGAKMYLNRVLGDVYAQAGRLGLDHVRVDGQVMTQGRLEVDV